MVSPFSLMERKRYRRACSKIISLLLMYSASVVPLILLLVLELYLTNAIHQGGNLLPELSMPCSNQLWEKDQSRETMANTGDLLFILCLPSLGTYSMVLFNMQYHIYLRLVLTLKWRYRYFFLDRIVGDSFNTSLFFFPLVVYPVVEIPFTSCFTYVTGSPFINYQLANYLILNVLVGTL